MAISGEGKLFTLIKCGSDEEWREERSNGLGASDAGAVMGLSRWKSPYEVWLEKTHREEPEDISGKPVVAFGNDFEEVAGRNFEKAHPGSKVRRVNAMCQSIERPYVRASLDFEAKLPGRKGWGVLEVKTTRTRSAFEDGLLDAYTAQVAQQLYVTGREWGVIWAFFRDTCEYGEYLVEPDAEDREALLEALDSFWGFVERDEPPQMVGLESESQALARQHPAASDEWVHSGEADELLSELEEISGAMKSLESDKRRIQDMLKAEIGNAKGLVTGTYAVTWARGERTTFDRKAFERDNPGLAAKYERKSVRDMGLRIRETGDREGRVG